MCYFSFFKLTKSVGKPRRLGTCGRGSQSEDDPEKENRRAGATTHQYREKALIESSDDDFDQCERVAAFKVQLQLCD